MSGDYSRIRFNPEKHFQGVLRQQGRVDLDADWNEYVDIQDRRWRGETIDIVGRCGVPLEMSNGFKIEGSFENLTVGAGRIYVDGLLAENHGATLQFSPALEENYGATPLPVSEQPYGMGTLMPEQGQRVLVYLDVWRREVTSLQDPELIEPAVNVDTTTRYQTAWRVKFATIDSDVTCHTSLAEILEESLPSAARLTTSTVSVSVESDPCLVPPSCGYQSLDSHLYRVEVHSVDDGEVGVKWSRENAHVGSQVVAILDDRAGVKVDSLGRDDVLCFKDNNWVEVINDHRELLGQAGAMRRVTVNKMEQTLTFTPALDDDGLDVADHLRVIRWDQAGSVLRPDGTELVSLDAGDQGVIVLTAAESSFVLEHGIQATLNVLAPDPHGSAIIGVSLRERRMPISNGSIWRRPWAFIIISASWRLSRPMAPFKIAVRCFLRSQNWRACSIWAVMARRLRLVSPCRSLYKSVLRGVSGQSPEPGFGSRLCPEEGHYKEQDRTSSM